VALATGTKGTLTVQSGDYEMLVNMAGARLIHENFLWLGAIPFTEEEHRFAKAIQRATGTAETGLRTEVEPLDEAPGEPEGGSTDVADVSWNVPTLHLSVTTAPADAPWHAWPVVASGGMSIGHKGMIHAAKALAATMVDLFEDDKAVAAVRKEFEESTAGKKYEGYIPAGPPPVPKD
jgi:aminobenzoyl-glutamate utilization protein B